MQVSTSACDPQQSVITLLIFATTCQHGTGQLLDIYLLRPRNNWHSLQFFCQVSVGGRWPQRTQPDENEVLEALVLSGQH